MSTVDGVMNTDDAILLESNEQSSTSSHILAQLDTLAVNQPATENAHIIQRPNIGLGVIKPASDNRKPIVIKVKSAATDGMSVFYFLFFSNFI